MPKAGQGRQTMLPGTDSDSFQSRTSRNMSGVAIVRVPSIACFVRYSTVVTSAATNTGRRHYYDRQRRLVGGERLV